MKCDLLEILNNKIPVYLKKCFVSGLIIGLITHFYMLTHKLPNWDDATNLSFYGSGDFLGRWFLKYIHPLGSKHSIPAVHGFLMIVLLSLSACVVMEILQVKSTTAALLISSLMVTFPSVACTMTFMFMAHTSALAIFMICVAVYLLRKYRWGCIPCTVLLICSLGVYQSYISIAITLILMGMLIDLIHEKEAKYVFKEGIISVVLLLITVLVYLKLSHIIFPNLDNQTYGGIGNAGNIAISQMPRLIARCYKRYLEFFIWKPFDFMSKWMQLLNIFVIAMLAILGIDLLIVKKIYKCMWNLLLYILCAVFLPLSMAFVYFMAPEVDYSMLMLYAYVLTYVFTIVLWENASISTDINMHIVKCFSIVMVVTMLLSCYSNYLLTNRAYLRMEVAFERVMAYYNRILYAVENTTGFEYGDRVFLAGEFYYLDNPAPIEGEIFDSENLREMSGVVLENGLLTSGVRDQFIEAFLGFDTGFSYYSSDWEVKTNILNSKEYIEMPIYPQNGCIEKIDDVWVVKLCD